MSILKSKKRHHYTHAAFGLLLLAFLWSAAPLTAQNRINSPYSMFGPGEVKGNEYFRNLALGGIAQGFRTNNSVNYINPASYTAIDSLSFVFEATVFSHMYRQKVANQEQLTTYSALGNINFAFPVTRYWRIAAGLLPYSQVGYNISDNEDLDGRINYFYEGSGGINQVYLGHGFRLFKGLSVGFNASYLFGKSEDRMIAASDSAGFYRTAWSYADDIDGFMLSMGMQWEIDLAENQKLTLGATFTPDTELNLTRNERIFRDLPGVWGIDTLKDVSGATGKMVIPQSLGVGAFYQFNNNWSAGLDLQTQSWSEFSSFQQNHNLNNSSQVRFGAIHRPQIETFSGFLSRWEYRAGLRYGQSFLNIDNQDFSEYGISFGLGIPLRRSLSTLNLGFEFSQRTPDSSDMISESFFRFNLGVNIYERWFVRRRFY